MTTLKTKAPPERSGQLEDDLLTEGPEGGMSDRIKERIKSYMAEAAKDPELQGQIAEQWNKNLPDFLEKNGYTRIQRLPMGEGVDGPDGGLIQQRLNMYKRLQATRQQLAQIAATGEGAGAKHLGQFESLGHFAQPVLRAIRAGSGAELDARLKALNESAGADGGFTVPEEFRAELLMLALESAIVRPRARVIPMGRQTVNIPMIRETSHASNVRGGITWQWSAEQADLSSTTNQPTFGQVRLDAKKLNAWTELTNELVNDSAINIGAIIATLYAEALAYAEDDAFIAGIGAAQPVGVLNADALVSVAKETGQTPDTVVWENIVKMFSRLLPGSMGRFVWYANPDVLPQLLTMSLNVGTGGGPIFMFNGAGGVPSTLLGRPLVFTEKAETVGDAGDIVAADFGYYLIGDRQAMTMDQSTHYRFNLDRLAIRITQRLDGRPWLESALTPRNGTNTLSAFVALAARA